MQVTQTPTHRCNGLCRGERHVDLVYSDELLAEQVLIAWDQMCEALGELRPAIGIQEALEAPPIGEGRRRGLAEWWNGRPASDEATGWLITWLDMQAP